jgi:hypothetical protein
MSSKLSIVNLAFADELVKVSGPRLSAALTGLGSFGGVGAGIGAGAGALYGAATGYRQARESGAGVGGSLLNGASSALSHGVAGAGVGGAIGGVAGASYGALNAAKSNAFHSALSDKSVLSRAGQRTVHGFTGHMPERGWDQLRGDSYDAAGILAGAKENLAKVQSQPNAGSFVDKLLKRDHASHIRGAEQRVSDAQRALAAAQASEAKGLTHLPGFVKGLVTKPVDTLRTSARHMWDGQSNFNKAMMVGLPVAQAGHALMGPEAAPGEESKAHRAVTGLVRGAANVVAAPLAGVANVIADIPATHLAGKVVDRLERRPQAPPRPLPSNPATPTGNLFPPSQQSPGIGHSAEYATANNLNGEG